MTSANRDVRTHCDVGDELEPIVNLYSRNDDGKDVLIFKAGERYKVIGSMMPRDVRVTDESGADATVGGDYFRNFIWHPVRRASE